MWNIFITLVIDLLAFTVILPLFPSIYEDFEHDNEDITYQLMNKGVSYIKNIVGAPDTPNNVLFGGILSSLFSLLQFFSSPIIGALSDVYGRKPLMILTSIGIASSYALWAFSSSFTLFVLSRIVGGVSRGNISLSTVIVGDVTTTESRNKGMATVGVAFSVGFLFGPAIGAWFATRFKHYESPFFYPALYALTLSIVNVFFIWAALPESLPHNNRSPNFPFRKVSSLVYPSSLFNFSAVTNVNKKDKESMKRLGLAYFLYLLIYSGLEYTLTFLTHSRFSYDMMQQGKMLSFMGIIMIIVQGGFVRRVKAGNEIRTVLQGIYFLIPSFIIIGVATNQLMFYSGLVLFSFASAMVVSCATSEISHYGSDDQKGTIMGIFRSLGALSRAFGPVTASAVYWCLSPAVCYCIGAACLFVPLLMLRSLTPKIK